MEHQTDIDGIRAKIATLEADRDRSRAADVKSNIQAEIDNWILIHAHVLLSTRFAGPEKARADLAPEQTVADPRRGFVHDVVSAIKHVLTPARQNDHGDTGMLLTAKQLIVIAFTLGVIVGAVAVWFLLRLK